MTFGSSVVDALHPWVDQIKVLKVVALLHPSVGGERPPEVKSVICAKKFSLFANCLSVLSCMFSPSKLLDEHGELTPLADVHLGLEFLFCWMKMIKSAEK